MTELGSSLHRYRFCPSLEMSFVEDVVSAWPALVSPKRDRDWKFVHGWDGGPAGALVLRYREGSTLIRVNAVGVAPSGPGALAEIAKRLKRRIDAP